MLMKKRKQIKKMVLICFYLNFVQRIAISLRDINEISLVHNFLSLYLHFSKTNYGIISFLKIL